MAAQARFDLTSNPCSTLRTASVDNLPVPYCRHHKCSHQDSRVLTTAVGATAATAHTPQSRHRRSQQQHDGGRITNRCVNNVPIRARRSMRRNARRRSVEELTRLRINPSVAAQPADAPPTAAQPTDAAITTPPTIDRFTRSVR
jgi:hypothetical protein